MSTFYLVHAIQPEVFTIETTERMKTNADIWQQSKSSHMSATGTAGSRHLSNDFLVLNCTFNFTYYSVLTLQHRSTVQYLQTGNYSETSAESMGKSF